MSRVVKSCGRNQEYSKIVQSITECSTFIKRGEKDLTSVHAYVITIKIETGDDIQTIRLFRKYSDPKIIKKSFLFTTDDFKRIDNDMIALDDRVDAISLNNHVYIVSPYHFENLFSYKSEYIKIRDEIVENIKEESSEIFSDKNSLNLFLEDCKDGRYVRQFVKIKHNNGIQTLKKYSSELSQIVNDFAMEISIENEKIKYKDKNSFSDVMKLLSGKFVYSALNKRPREATATRPR